MREGRTRHVTPFGRDREEFAVGDVCEHRPSRPVTESDDIDFSLVTTSFHPMHGQGEGFDGLAVTEASGASIPEGSTRGVRGYFRIEPHTASRT